ELRSLLDRVGIGAVFVTHDQDEALSLAGRVAVMHTGHIAQIGTPRGLYDAPASIAVARAVGEANILRGQARSGTVTCALGELPGSGPDGDVSVVVRPEALVLGDEGTPARIVARDYVGREEVVWIAVDG